MQYTDNSQEVLRSLPMGSSLRVYREEVQDGWVHGYLVGLGPDHFAVHCVDESIRLNGFACLRIADVTMLESPDPFEAFVQRALELRGVAPAPACPVDLFSVEALLRSSRAAYSLVTLHPEDDEDVCFIGEIVTVDSDEVALKTISPSAQWDGDVDSFALAEICEIDVGDDYADMLARVNAEPD